MKSRETSEGVLGTPVNGSLKISGASTGCSCCDDSVVSSRLGREARAVAGDDVEAYAEELAATPEECSENCSRSIMLRLVVDWQNIVVAPVYDQRAVQIAPEKTSGKEQ